MIYKNIKEGIFKNRTNRFVAEIEINSKIETCHVKNTGRCKELLIPEAKVYVNESNNPARSTKYDLVSVYKNDRLINMDSQAPNIAFEEFLLKNSFIENIKFVKRETKYGNSRFDFYVEAEERKIFIEVKGVTLEDNCVVMFPDAPTERGVKHLNELKKCIVDGYEAYVIFVIQMQGVSYFTPNYKTHAEFGKTLTNVINAGVTAVAYDCIIEANTMTINEIVPIKL